MTSTFSFTLLGSGGEGVQVYYYFSVSTEQLAKYQEFFQDLHLVHLTDQDPEA